MRRLAHGISVRDAAAADTPYILDLLYELGRPGPAREGDEGVYGELIAGYAADADKRIAVAEHGDAGVVGMIAMMLLPRLNRQAPEMYVPEIVVRRGFRRRGVGRALMGHCVEAARGIGCHRIRLESGNRRTSSHAFYRSLGFEQPSLSFTMGL